MFKSLADNLVPDDTNGFGDVFVHDRQTGMTNLVSINGAGGQGNDTSTYSSMSADERFMVFESAASNLVGADTNQTWDIFLAHGPAVLFVDGFESGSFSRWSASSP